MNIEERIKSLEKREQTVTSMSKVVRDFISDTTEIKPSVLYPGFYLDDITLYKEAINDIEREENTLKVIRTIVYYIASKFGMESYSKERMHILCSGNADEFGFSKGVSIRKFIDKNAAMCLERAAFLHNSLKILGFDDVLKIGSMKYSEEEGNHAYNLLITKNGNYVLVDPSNFVIKIKNGKRRFTASIFKLTKKEYDGLINEYIVYNANRTKHPQGKYLENFMWLYS